jgi:hypothetical protein
MNKKWKIFGIQTNVEWYDIKTKFKQILRKIVYSWFFQELICLIFFCYMWFVYLTSKKKFVNQEIVEEVVANKNPLIILLWHNRLMMVPFAARKIRKKFPSYNFMTLASKHGDGRFVSKITEKFKLISILGSSKDGRKTSRGIDLGSLKKIFSGLKKGYSIAITPDGPRGPNQKINGEVIEIARISGAGILTISYSSSKYKQMNTWDKFKIPLPFSKICFYINKEIIFVDKNSDKTQKEKLKEKIEQKLNEAQNKSEELVLK